MKQFRGFTLAELLVVIAIVAILASLLFPILGKARSRAFLVQDVSQMRQLYISIDTYSNDSDEHLPDSLLYLAPYTKSTAIFTSPVDPYRSGMTNW